MRAKNLKWTWVAILAIALISCTNSESGEMQSQSQAKGTPVSEQPVQIVMETSAGNIELELYPDKAPISVKNFLGYVESGFYDNTIFHRVIRGFMIQGGGFDKDHKEKESGEPIVNEAGNGLMNKRGTIAYARTNVINSATSQFFINHQDNPNLDHRDESQAGFGYAVFGKVTKGMEVVDKIAGVKTGSRKVTINYQGKMFEQPYQDVPVTPVVIKTVKVIK